MSSYRSCTDTIQGQKVGPTIPQIFREHGEEYIRIYHPPLDHIKFIRAVRLCKSPGLGGRIMECKKCHHLHYIYFSCGHARCPCCQAVKREQWLDKTMNLLLDVPYVHLVTTVPHQLNRLNKLNPKEMYNLLFSSTKLMVNQIMEGPVYVGGKPGMISLLHTFGSDIKYHVHVHSMLTFGGLTPSGKWIFPKHKKRICRNSLLRSTFKKSYLAELKKLFDSGVLNYDKTYDKTIEDIKDKNWTVFISHPSMSTKGIMTYISRYINRVAISESRVEYVKKARAVNIIYKDYRNSLADQAPPIEIKTMPPLLFMHQMLQHLPPPYFHRCRRYGLHANAKNAMTKEFITNRVKENTRIIRTVMEILKDLMKLEQFKCEKCEHSEFLVHRLKPNDSFIFQYITIPKIRSPTRKYA